MVVTVVGQKETLNYSIGGKSVTSPDHPAEVERDEQLTTADNKG